MKLIKMPGQITNDQNESTVVEQGPLLPLDPMNEASVDNRPYTVDVSLHINSIDRGDKTGNSQDTLKELLQIMKPYNNTLVITKPDGTVGEFTVNSEYSLEVLLSKLEEPGANIRLHWCY